MANLTFNGQRLLFPGGGILDYTYIDTSGNVLDWNGGAIVSLDSQPDLSGTKRIDFNLWLDQDSGYASKTIFTLGVSEDNLFAELTSANIRIGNADVVTTGTRTFSITGLSGKKLECIVVKGSTTIDWFSVNGVSLTQTGIGQSNRPTTKSAIGGGADNQWLLDDAYVWDVVVDGEGAWSGNGSNANTNASWVDTIGSADGTITGTPAIKKLTLTDPSYDDWYLPSIDELEQMYLNLYLNGSGGTWSAFYWSSTENNATQAESWAMTFDQQFTQSKGTDQNVRVSRNFTTTPGTYSLGDVGPAGGWIYYINGSSFYEAAEEDQGVADWSNITNGLIGTTGTAIGTGSSNTTAILGQASHLYSAALLGNTYFV